MFTVWFIAEDKSKCVFANAMTNQPILFSTMEEAWGFVSDFMNDPNHPRFMWVKEV